MFILFHKKKLSILLRQLCFFKVIYYYVCTKFKECIQKLCPTKEYEIFELFVYYMYITNMYMTNEIFHENISKCIKNMWIITVIRFYEREINVLLFYHLIIV